MRTPWKLLALAGTVGFVGCSGGDGTSAPPPAPKATQLSFLESATGGTAGVAISPAVRVQALTAGGQLDATFSGAITLALGQAPGATLLGTTTVSAVGGVATFPDLRVEKSGNGYVLLATATSLQSKTSPAFTIIPNNPRKLKLSVQSTTVEVMQPIDPEVSVFVVDSFGNQVPNVNGTVTMLLAANPGGVALQGDRSAALSGGTATFANLRFDGPGTALQLIASNAAFAWDSSSNNINARLTLKSISAGYQHTCGVNVDGRAFCWGDNTTGQLGIATTTPFTARPRAVQTGVGFYAAGGPKFVKIAAGERHSCGATFGLTYCWGNDSYGQLGHGATPQAYTTADTLHPFVKFAYFEQARNPTTDDVAAGALHSCVVTGTRLVACSGWNILGQLGNGTRTDRQEGSTVTGLTGASNVAAGAAHSCALLVGGAVRCWGLNSFGQLGNGTTASSNIPVGTGGAYQAVTAAGDHTCALSVGSPIAFCWGLNSSGQLGDGTTANKAFPSPVAGGHTFAIISAGAYYAPLLDGGGNPVFFGQTCGVRTDGVVLCWGSNDRGQLGDGTRVDRQLPTPVQGGNVFTMLSVGSRHACGVTQSGAAYCWGNNSRGQLGDGTQTDRLVPTRILQ